jgi:hypothetical protein
VYRRIAAFAFAIALLAGVAAPVSADNELSSVASTFYIVATGGDNSIAPLVHSLTDRFQQLFDAVPGQTVWVLPRMNWGASELANQCNNDPGKDTPNGPKVLGGMVLEATNTYSSTDPLILVNHGWTKVSTDAQLVSCATTGFKNPTITWNRDNLSGYGSRNGIGFETVVSGILYFALKNQSAKDILLSTAVGGISGASTIPPVNDALTERDAAERLANDVVLKLNAACASADQFILPMCQKMGLPKTKLPTPRE